MEKVAVLLPMLVFLACPLLMVFCLFGMSRRDGRAQAAEPHEATRTIEERTQALQRQLQAIHGELAVLKAAEARTRRDKAAADDDQAAAFVPGAPDAVRQRA